MAQIKSAMVLAAGLGTRMRPLTDRIPKPLAGLGGRPLLDHVLDRLAMAGVERAVVNVHHFADQIEAHLKTRKEPAITISDERGAILETGGGVLKALAAYFAKGAGEDCRSRPASLLSRGSEVVVVGNASMRLLFRLTVQA